MVPGHTLGGLRLGKRTLWFWIPHFISSNQKGGTPQTKTDFFVKVVYLFIFYMILGGGTGNSQVVIERPFDNG